MSEPTPAFEDAVYVERDKAHAILIQRLLDESGVDTHGVNERVSLMDKAAEALQHDEEVIQKLAGLSKGFVTWARKRIKALEAELEQMKRLHEAATENNAALRIELDKGPNRVAKIVKGKFDANGAPEVEWLIECPHWSPGKITLRKGCTACEAEEQR